MNNKVALTLKEVIPKFKNILEGTLSTSIDTDILSPLANMLAMHHIDKVDEYDNLAKIASSRLRGYLGKRVVIDYDFSIVLGLFAIAITDAETYHDDITDNIKNSKNIDALIKQVCSDGNTTEAEHNIEEFIRHLISKKTFPEILNYIHSKQKEAGEVFSKLSKIPELKKKDALYKELFAVFGELARNQSKNEQIKNSLTMLCSIGTCAAMSSTCVYGLDLLASVAIIPSTFFGLTLFLKPIKNIIDNTIDTVYPPKTSDSIIENTIGKLKVETEKAAKSQPEPTQKIAIDLSNEMLQEAGKFLRTIKSDNIDQNLKIKQTDKLLKSQNETKKIQKHRHL